MKTVQNKVADLVKQQSQSLYTSRQLAARQVAEIVDSLADMAKFIELPAILSKIISVAGEIGKHQLNNPEIWDTETFINYRFAEELANLQVTIFSLADTVDKLIDGGYNIVERALEKVETDIKRKVK